MCARKMFSICVYSVAALMLTAGCASNSKKESSAKTQTKPATNSSVAANNKAPENKPAENPKPVPTPVAVHPTPTPAPVNAAPTPVKSEPLVNMAASNPPPEPAAQPNSDDEKREAASNMIYATIRVKMEEAIDERAKLLKSGTDPSDTHVRDLEGRIMRARDLLTQNGEIVEEVDPPIVQKNP